MKVNKFFSVSLILIFALSFSSCQKKAAQNDKNNLASSLHPLPLFSMPANSASGPTPIPLFSMPVNSVPKPALNSPIRKIDFNNFTYQKTYDYPAFTLKNGEKPFEFGKDDGINLGQEQYVDLTSDSAEEAILTMSIQTGGSSMPDLIYIYTLQNGKPKLIWGFATGDRAKGGLKKIYHENGEFVIETLGDSKYKNGRWEYGYPKNNFRGDCCPTAYTKIRFKWDGKKFTVQGSPEVFDYDDNNQNE